MRISDWSSDVCSSDIGDGIRFPGSRAMLDQIALANALMASCINQLIDHIPLVVTGENQRFAHARRTVKILYLGLLQVKETRQHIQGRKSVVEGKSVSLRVDLGGGGLIKKKKQQ